MLIYTVFFSDIQQPIPHNYECKILKILKVPQPAKVYANYHEQHGTKISKYSIRYGN